ncbi:MAG: DNA primase, partial [Candidatus Pacebacteria bacterium]|nr:DNA primase [Candidatus Paceibacterota bacterium]
MSSSVEKIKERLSIVDVVSSYISVIPAGKNYKAKCPFHNEKTPSFFISSERDSYYCFGCGAKGDIFSFVENFEGVDFLGALKILATRAGVSLEKNFSNAEKDKKEKLYEIMEEATTFFEKMFEEDTRPRAYLLNRGLSDKTIKNFRIGYAPDSWRSVSAYLIKKGFKKEDLETVGLVKTKEGTREQEKEDDHFYDRFRSRIIFPINDSSGRVIAFSGRIFGEENKEAKYLNSPETPLFNKSNTLFGIDKAKLPIRKYGYSIVVEGQMDLILSHQAGFDNTVAVSGTALSDRVNERVLSQEDSSKKINNLGLIRRLSPNVIFAFDGDQAGIRATNRSALIALSLDMQVKVTSIKEGKDPADIILENPDEWKDLIKNSKNIINFHLDRICEETDDIRLRGKKIKEVIFPFLAIVKSSIEKSAYFSLINRETGIPENAIIEDFERYENLNKINSVELKDEDKLEKENKTRRQRLEEKLFGILFWQEDNKNQIIDITEIKKSIEDKIEKDIFNQIYEKHKSNRGTLAF